LDITIFGSGYVGLVTGACFADSGNRVTCVDVDTEKVALLNAGRVPIFEPGLEALIERNRAAGNLSFTCEPAAAIKSGYFQFIAVGTPADENGSADLKYVLEVARTIGRTMTERKIIVTKSTVPVGTADKVRAAIEEELSSRDLQIDFDVVSNPEFLKEGDAINDCMRPDRIIIGVDNQRVGSEMHSLYASYIKRNDDALILMDVRSAELTKYAANAMLATKISFMNELSNIADRVGANIEEVRHGIGSDRRIGNHFIYPGPGYGGSCFPKDVTALHRMAGNHGYTAELLDAVESVNARQKRVLFDKVIKHFDGDLKGRSFALWGLAFKPNTDDMREAPSRVLMESLWSRGARVKAYDPEAMDEVRRIYGDRDDLQLCATSMEALDGCDGLVVVTEWKAFWNPDFSEIKTRLESPVIFDGRNIYDPQSIRSAGFSYYSIGRPFTGGES
jgi:UDPglucose 6-dehydrogenase